MNKLKINLTLIFSLLFLSCEDNNNMDGYGSISLTLNTQNNSIEHNDENNPLNNNNNLDKNLSKSELSKAENFAYIAVYQGGSIIASETVNLSGVTSPVSANFSSIPVGSTTVEISLLDNISLASARYEANKTVSVQANSNSYVSYASTDWNIVNQSVGFTTSFNNSYEIGDEIYIGITNSHPKEYVRFDLYKKNSAGSYNFETTLADGYDPDPSTSSSGFTWDTSTIGSNGTYQIHVGSGNATAVSSEFEFSDNDGSSIYNVTIPTTQVDGYSTPFLFPGWDYSPINWNITGDFSEYTISLYHVDGTKIYDIETGASGSVQYYYAPLFEDWYNYVFGNKSADSFVIRVTGTKASNGATTYANSQVFKLHPKTVAPCNSNCSDGIPTVLTNVSANVNKSNRVLLVEYVKANDNLIITSGNTSSTGDMDIFLYDASDPFLAQYGTPTGSNASGQNGGNSESITYSTGSEASQFIYILLHAFTPYSGVNMTFDW
jgi:hypothetical protein